MICLQYPSNGSTRNRSFNNRVVSGAVSANEHAEAAIGKKVRTRWPEDNNFYEAVVTQYNAVEVTSNGREHYIETDQEFRICVVICSIVYIYVFRGVSCTLNAKILYFPNLSVTSCVPRK